MMMEIGKVPHLTLALDTLSKCKECRLRLCVVMMLDGAVKQYGTEVHVAHVLGSDAVMLHQHEQSRQASLNAWPHAVVVLNCMLSVLPMLVSKR